MHAQKMMSVWLSSAHVMKQQACLQSSWTPLYSYVLLSGLSDPVIDLVIENELVLSGGLMNATSGCWMFPGLYFVREAVANTSQDAVARHQCRPDIIDDFLSSASSCTQLYF